MVGRTAGSFANGKVGIWKAPLVGIRYNTLGFVSTACAFNCLSKIGGDSIMAGKDPGTDRLLLIGIPFKGIDATSLFVEWFANSTFIRAYSNTSLIGPLMRSQNVAIIGWLRRIEIHNSSECIGKTCRPIPMSCFGPVRNMSKHIASVRGMEGSFGNGLVVDSLHNVDLAVVGPVFFVSEPPRWPNTASCRHVAKVKDEQSPIVSRFPLQPDGFTWAFLRGSRFHVDELFFLSRGSISI
mmetsp:Transcript_11068/g.22618  ORF Transcript_11068/g.22618 Transcript_11068/m.22618 type:complete len:239 (-) Transcript_11068:505-1221(-)